jgi:hypothetical protein
VEKKEKHIRKMAKRVLFIDPLIDEGKVYQLHYFNTFWELSKRRFTFQSAMTEKMI